MVNRAVVLGALAVLCALPYGTKAQADELGFGADPMMDCFATCGNDSRLFAGRGVKWIARSRAISACREWAQAHGQAPEACVITECAPLDPYASDYFPYLRNVSPAKPSIAECLADARLAYDKDLALENDRVDAEYQTCLRYPLPVRLDYCAYEVGVEHDSRVKLIESRYEQAQLRCAH